MATLGSTSHVSDTAQATSGTTNSQVATPLTMAENGILTNVSVYMAGYGGTCSTQCAVWNTSSTQLANSSSFTASSQSFSNGNSVHYNPAVDQISLTSGTTYRCGWLRTTSADGFQWDRDDGSGKTTYLGDGLTGDMTSVSTDSSRKPNVYITYVTVPELYVRRSGAWVKVTAVYVRRSGVWDDIGNLLYVRRSGAWVLV